MGAAAETAGSRRLRSQVGWPIDRDEVASMDVDRCRFVPRFCFTKRCVVQWREA
jgi:hypothetical protein